MEVLPIASQGWTADQSNQSHSVLKLTGTITGSFTQANEFIYRLQHGEYKRCGPGDIFHPAVSGLTARRLFPGTIRR